MLVGTMWVGRLGVMFIIAQAPSPFYPTPIIQASYCNGGSLLVRKPLNIHQCRYLWTKTLPLHEPWPWYPAPETALQCLISHGSLKAYYYNSNNTNNSNSSNSKHNHNNNDNNQTTATCLPTSLSLLRSGFSQTPVRSFSYLIFLVLRFQSLNFEQTNLQTCSSEL